VTDSPPDTCRRPVVATAMEMFNRQSYDEISVEDIAVAAGVPGRECYRRYGGKLGIYLASLHQAVDDAVATVARDGPDDARGRLRYGLRAYMDHLTTHPIGHLYLSPGASTGNGVEQYFREELRRTVTRALLRCVGHDPPGPLRTLVPGWVALAESMFCDWVRGGVPNREDFETVLCDLFFAVVETADGVRN
jgi:AcrR family transcriptional regulator